MPDLWMPGAVRKPQPLGVALDRSLPPRAVEHITADRLDEVTMAQPPFENVEGYLIRAKYCPTVMLDPFTGYRAQYYPADVGARALSRWNEDGKVNLQVEIYFSPGVIRDGEQYFTVEQTPCRGVEDFIAWAESWGVPRVWPMGEPTWDAARDADIWNTQAGHYGHSQVPGENHGDPGPMPPLTRPSPTSAGRTLLIPDVEGLYA